MPKKRSKPKTDPVIAKLSEQANGEPVAELQGYVGPSGDDVIRLYGSRQMNSYVDIPQSAVLHIVEPENENNPTMIYTLASTEVRFTSVRSAKLTADQIPAIAGSQVSFGLGDRGIIIVDNHPADQNPAISASQMSFGPGERGIIIVEARPAAEGPAILNSRVLLGLGQRGIIIVNG